MDGEVDLAIYTSTQNSEGYGDIQMVQAELPAEVNLMEPTADPVAAVAEVSADIPTVEVPKSVEVPILAAPAEEHPKPEEPISEEMIIPGVAPESNQPSPAEPIKTATDSRADSLTDQVPAQGMAKAALPLRVLDINSLDPIAYSITIKNAPGRETTIEAKAGEEIGLPQGGFPAMEWVITSPGYL